MADTNTTFIDLDAVDLPRKLVVKLGGKEHELVPVTVESFVANTKLLQKLGAQDGDLEAEVNTVIEVILRAFPTMTDKMLRAMPLANLNKLMAAAQNDDGTKAVQNAVAKEAPANPPAAAE
ncbi:hypothetical protein [Methylobacterium sp. AMS5]|uniref:hypothetical protein n=1 Tax=Methylobacterium sp. AMS5 TaxID=925818 RepID=UPI00074F8B41|nr:hypothetical protein [Methylobacterium sp. AMS5]AMB48261.1 hypothetical protein Y590_25170 [Methylobacterium sp. AMS5]